jgi:hypothetical protein
MGLRTGLSALALFLLIASAAADTAPSVSGIYAVIVQDICQQAFSTDSQKNISLNDPGFMSISVGTAFIDGNVGTMHIDESNVGGNLIFYLTSLSG